MSVTYKVGANDFYLEVTDTTTGEPITGLGISDFIISSIVEDIPTTAPTSASELSGGIYKIPLTFTENGKGFLSVKAVDSDYVVTPTFTNLDIVNRSTDELYSLIFATTITPVTTELARTYGRIGFTQKEGDDWINTFSVPSSFTPLTDWTDFSVKLYPSTRLNDSSVPSISGTTSVTVIDDIQGIIEVIIENDATTSIVPSGGSSATFYADVQGIDSDGYRRTITEITYTARRDFNS